MRLSVAMATYNGGRFLREQLNSIAEQTLLPDELVVSDDGSTDDTLAIVERFGRTSPFPVRLLVKDARLGFADNFLFAATSCAHEAVAFCDQDDVWLPTKLEVGLGRLLRDDSLLSMHRLTLTDEALNPTGQLDQGIAGDAVFDPLQIDPYVTGWGNTMIFRRSLASLIPRERRPRQPGLSRPLSHDTWLYLLAAALGRVSHIAAPLILYRQHSANAVGIEPPTTTERIRTICADPTPGMQVKRAFDAAMATLFADLSAEASDDLAGRAARAAARFAARSAYLDRRIDLYHGSTLLRRLAAFRATLRARGEDEALLAGRGRAAVKDMALGVTGLARRLEARSWGGRQ